MLTYNDEYFMQQALNEAQKAYDIDEVPIGAVIVVNNKIISRGHNQVEQLNDSTAHAEILALTAAFNYLGAKYLPDATIYITVEPCHMCAGALYWSKIRRIVFGATDIKNGYHCFYGNKNPFHPKSEITEGILAAECATTMKNFFAERR